MYPHREIGIQPNPARQLGNPGMLDALASHIAGGKPVAILEAPHGIGDLLALPQQLNELGVQNVQACPQGPELSGTALLLRRARIRAIGTRSTRNTPHVYRAALRFRFRGTPRLFATH